MVRWCLTKVCVSIGGNHFEDTIINGQKGHAKSSSTQIKDKYVFLPFFLVHTIGDGSGSPMGMKYNDTQKYTNEDDPSY